MAYYTSLWYSITRKKNPQFICYWTDGQFRFQIFYIANSASVNTPVTESMSVHWDVSPGLLRHEGWTASILLAVIKSFPGGAIKNPLASVGDMRLIPWSGRAPGEGHGNPLQYSCLENLMDRRASWATVHRVTKSRAQLKQLSTCTHSLGSLCDSLIWG